MANFFLFLTMGIMTIFNIYFLISKMRKLKRVRLLRIKTKENCVEPEYAKTINSKYLNLHLVAYLGISEESKVGHMYNSNLPFDLHICDANGEDEFSKKVLTKNPGCNVYIRLIVFPLVIDEIIVDKHNDGKTFSLFSKNFDYHICDLSQFNSEWEGQYRVTIVNNDSGQEEKLLMEEFSEEVKEKWKRLGIKWSE